MLLVCLRSTSELLEERHVHLRMGSNEQHDESSITRLLERTNTGDLEASRGLYDMVYKTLRAMAAKRLSFEQEGHSLQPTELVHEVFMKFFGTQTRVDWQNSAHFFRAAAQSMRRILIDHAKTRQRAKRGGNRKRVDLDWLGELGSPAVDLAHSGDPEAFLALEAAICRLESEDPQAGDVVRLRYFAGMSEPETAKALGVSERTVRRRWVFAKAWLFDCLSGTTLDGGSTSE